MNRSHKITFQTHEQREEEWQRDANLQANVVILTFAVIISGFITYLINLLLKYLLNDVRHILFLTVIVFILTTYLIGKTLLRMDNKKLANSFLVFMISGMSYGVVTGIYGNVPMGILVAVGVFIVGLIIVWKEKRR